jgi:beta-glucanase (GH16 family)
VTDHNLVLNPGDKLTVTVPAAPTPPPSLYTFADDFTAGLQAHWLNDPCGVFGSETIEFRNDLCSVVNGVLEVQAVRSSANKWRCGHLSTWGDFEQEFGTWEARIKVPKGRGLWPAFWPLKSGATACAGGIEEFDIMEILANPMGERGQENVNTVFQTLHHPPVAGRPNGNVPGGVNGSDQSMRWTNTGIDLSLAYHTYGMEWRSDFVQFTLDGAPTHRIPIAIRGKAHIRLNMAVGGWPGPSDATTPSPAKMLVDWVRVSA